MRKLVRNIASSVVFFLVLCWAFQKNCVIAIFTLCTCRRQIFERHYNAEGTKHKDFCELFGPEKIPENVGEFVSYFLVRKVMASAGFIGQAARVAEKLCKWLVTKGYAADDIEYAAPRASTAAKQLPRAQKAGELLWKEATGGVIFNAEPPDESGYMDITRIEPGHDLAATDWRQGARSDRCTDDGHRTAAG